MALTPADETELLTALYEGVSADPAWPALLGRLRRRLRADHLSLLLARGRAGVAHLSAGLPGRDRDADHGRIEALLAHDAAAGHRLRPDRVYTADDDPARDAARTGVEAPIPPGWGMRRVRVVTSDEYELTIVGLREREDFAAADSAVLARLVPHVAVALRTLALLDAARHRATTADALLARLGVTWRAFDGRALGDCDEIATYEITVERVFRPLDAAAAAALVRRFALTAGEAQLAVALANGATLAEAATGRGLTIESARTYAKRIFAKTQARGQADLVRIVLTGAAALAEDRTRARDG